jgi:hypothetical protein
VQLDGAARDVPSAVTLTDALASWVLNAYRFALEQRKPLATFAPLAAGETMGNAVIASESPRRRQESLLASDRI